jgi:hypothetical protein
MNDPACNGMELAVMKDEINSTPEMESKECKVEG